MGSAADVELHLGSSAMQLGARDAVVLCGAYVSAGVGCAPLLHLVQIERWSSRVLACFCGYL